MNYRDIIKKLFDKAPDYGYNIFRVDDGEETVRTKTFDEVMDVVESVELSYLHVRLPDNSIGWVVLIPCNGEDVVSDYTMSLDEFVTSSLFELGHPTYV